MWKCVVEEYRDVGLMELLRTVKEVHVDSLSKLADEISGNTAVFTVRCEAR